MAEIIKWNYRMEIQYIYCIQAKLELMVKIIICKKKKNILWITIFKCEETIGYVFSCTVDDKKRK